MFSLNHLAFLADLLDGIKDTDPDTGGYDREETGSGALFRHKHRILQDKGENARHHYGEKNRFPVPLVHKDPEKLSYVDFNLRETSLSFHILRFHFLISFLFSDIFRYSNPPCLRRLHPDD